MIKLLSRMRRRGAGASPVITYRAAVQPLRRAVAGETGSHFLKGRCTPLGCEVTAWRVSRHDGFVPLCDHGRVQPLSNFATESAARELPYFAPLCR